MVEDGLEECIIRVLKSQVTVCVKDVTAKQVLWSSEQDSDYPRYHNSRLIDLTTTRGIQNSKHAPGCPLFWSSEPQRGRPILILSISASRASTLVAFAAAGLALTSRSTSLPACLPCQRHPPHVIQHVGKGWTYFPTEVPKCSRDPVSFLRHPGTLTAELVLLQRAKRPDNLYRVVDKADKRRVLEQVAEFAADQARNM